MAKCIQNFKSVLNSKKIKKFLNESINQDLLLEKINLDNENNKWTQLSDGISNLIIEISNENKAINSYDFFSLSENLTNTLKLYTSEFENFDQNLDDLVFDIVNKVKSNYVKSFVYDTNPIVDENRIYDFSSIMKLVYNNDSYMNYLNSLINIGLFKVIFINSLDTNNKDYPYEGFVTTDAALNKNIALYKNELWDYIYRYYLNNHPNPIKIKDSNLYILSRISSIFL